MSKKVLVSTDRIYRDRISGDVLLNLLNWCAPGPDRKIWPDEDVRIKEIEGGMLLETQFNVMTLGFESLKDDPEYSDMMVEGSKILRFHRLVGMSNFMRLLDFDSGEKVRKFMSKYQKWLLPLLNEEEKQELESKMDGVIEFLVDKMKMTDMRVYIGCRAYEQGCKGSLVFIYTKNDAPTLLILAHGVKSVYEYNYMTVRAAELGDGTCDYDTSSDDDPYKDYVFESDEDEDPYVGPITGFYADADVDTDTDTDTNAEDLRIL